MAKLIVYAGNVTIRDDILALTARFGPGLPKTKPEAYSFFLANTEPFRACFQPVPPLPSGQAVLVQRGECRFASKALRVQRLGAAAAIIVNDEEEGIVSMSCEPWELIDSLVTIPVVMISKSSGEYLRLALATSPFPISVSLYAPPMLDPEVLVLWALALLSLVGASAWAAAEEKAALEGRSGAGQFLADQPQGDPSGANDKSAVTEVGFVVILAVMLLLLMYHLSTLAFYIIGSLFVVTVIWLLHVCLSSLFYWLFPLPSPRSSCFSRSFFLTSLALAISWAFFHDDEPNNWGAQDILGVALMITVLQAVRLPNIKVPTVLLSLAFFYDIFWVFNVAAGERTWVEGIPSLFKVPNVMARQAGYFILSFGDVVLPGLLVVFTRRYDCIAKKLGIDGYYLPAILGYAVGLLLTVVAHPHNEATQMFLLTNGNGHPAMLYLVPCTLGVVVLLAWRRGELGTLWNGKESSAPRVPEDSLEEPLVGPTVTQSAPAVPTAEGTIYCTAASL